MNFHLFDPHRNVTYHKVGALLIVLAFLSSCQVNPSVMFKDKDNKTIGHDSLIKTNQYCIRPGDLLEIDFYSKMGLPLIEENASISTFNSLTMSKGATAKPKFLVELNGQVKIPLVGKVSVKDLSIPEVEKKIENALREFYNEPFVIARVTNRRVMVFPGTGGAGRVIDLSNEEMTLVEVLALAGGLTERGKAKNIKIIRGDHQNPTVILVNLSTMESYSKSDIRIQADDIIYVEPVPRISQEVLSQLAPVVGIVTSLALLYQIANTIK